jgi:hypothetical protein
MNINLDHISVEHKREALATYCQKRNLCYDLHTNDECPLFEVASAGGGCFANATPNEIERNYELVFGDKERDVETIIREDLNKAIHEVIEAPCEHGTFTGDMVNHPQHYNHGSMECIDEMILIFGVEAVMDFCVCNAWKYRARAAYKGNPEEDMAKADWYLAKYKELEEKDKYGYYKLP